MGFLAAFFCDWYFNKLFLLQLFDIGNSAGSLVNEALGLFKTFQKISAPKSFSTRFSDEGEETFSWTKDIINSITSRFKVNPLSDFEQFQIYANIIPIMILTFISALTSGYEFMLYLVASILFFGLGTGIGYIGEKNIIAFPLIIITGVIIILGLFLKRFKIFQCFNVFHYFFNKCKCKSKCHKKSDKEEEDSISSDDPNKKAITCCTCKSNVQFTYATLATSIIFIALTIPIFKQRYPLQLLCALVFPPIIILMFFVDLIDRCCCKRHKLHLTKITGKVICLVLNCISLLIVPTTEVFVKLIQEDYKSKWNCIVNYVVFGLAFPFIMTLMMIKTNLSQICEKYNQPTKGHQNFFYYVELIDITKQIGFAILASYDQLWGCLTIEIAWVLIVFIIIPYRNVSDYSLAFGNSLLVFITNGVLLYGQKHGFTLFGFKTAIKFVIIACIPAVLSGYLYFIFDFEVELEEKNHEFDDIDDSQLNSSEEEEKYGFDKKAIDKLSALTKALTPFGWFFYGLNISAISKKINL